MDITGRETTEFALLECVYYDKWPETFWYPTFLFFFLFLSLSCCLSFQSEVWHDILGARLSDWGIMINAYMQNSERRRIPHCHPHLSEALCSSVFISSFRHICWRLSDIYYQSLFEASHSCKILLISDSMSCLIFQTSRWPFQRTNKVLKMQVLSSCERQPRHSPSAFSELTPRCLCY